jgi:hypothetical protein
VSDQIIQKALALPFDKGDERTFTGRGGKTFTYIDDERVMDRLDKAGVDWQIPEISQAIGEKAVKVTLQVRYPDSETWLQYQDYGYPTNADDGAEWLKEAVSDGIRRVGRMVGVARYLYRGSGGPSAPENRPVGPAQAPQQTEAPFAPIEGGEGGSCPTHHKPWRVNSKGYYCPTKAREGEKANAGGWCDEHPSKAWQASHER